MLAWLKKRQFRPGGAVVGPLPTNALVRAQGMVSQN